MSETLKVRRLGKVALEFNVSRTTIVDFLKAKKYDVEDNPNTKIAEDVYSLLQSEFQSEKSSKEDSKKVVLPVIKNQGVTYDDNARVGTFKQNDQEDLVIKNIHGLNPDDIFKVKVDMAEGVKIVSQINPESFAPKAKPAAKPIVEEKAEEPVKKGKA